MKKQFTLHVGNPTNGKDGVTHIKSTLEVSKYNDFRAGVDTVVYTLDSADPEITDISTFSFVLDFDRPNRAFYTRSKVFFSDGTDGGERPISIISETGGSHPYQYSDTILITPEVVKLSPSLDIDDDFEFEISDFKVYTGRGELTHVSWRLSDENSVVWERPKDPSNLKSIKLPCNLEPGKSYTLEAAFHSGDIMSNYGRSHFVTDDVESSVFDVKFKREENGRYVIDNSTYNHLLVTTKYNKFTGLTWSIINTAVITALSEPVTLNESAVLNETPISNEIAVLNESSVSIEETPTDPKSFFISGFHLSVNEMYTLQVKCVIDGLVYTREFPIIVRDGYDNSNYQTFDPSTNAIITTDATCTDLAKVTLVDDRITFSVKDNKLVKRKRVGAVYIIVVPQVSPEFTNMKIGSDARVDIIDDKLIVQIIEEIQIGTDIITNRVMYVYHYDDVNKEVFNKSTYKRILIQNVVNSLEPFEFAHTGFNELSVVNVSEAFYVVTRYNLISGAISTLPNSIINLGTIADLGSAKTPTIAKVDAEHLLILSLNKTLIYSNKINVVAELQHIDTNNINLVTWTHLSRTTNGDIFFVGLNDNVVGEEIITYYKFNREGFIFEVIATKQIPVEGDIRFTGKPNISITNNNFLGLLYPNLTYWKG